MVIRLDRQTDRQRRRIEDCDVMEIEGRDRQRQRRRTDDCKRRQKEETDRQRQWDR